MTEQKKRSKVLITDFFAKKQKTKIVEASRLELETNSLELKDKTSLNTEKASRLHTDTSDDKPFNKNTWISTLSPEQQDLLNWEIKYLHDSWLAELYPELTKPYFLQLKSFLSSQQGKATIFPAPHHVYSWSHLTPLPQVKCLVLGQDPYHNHNQAHGLAFSVLEPTRPPPSLVNIYKTLSIDFPQFVTPQSGDLTAWAKRGVLMLNAALTVEAHKANSHAKKGWEQFTEEIIRVAIKHHRTKGFVIMAWGLPAQKRVEKFQALTHPGFTVLRSVHPSPLSAHRGFFTLAVFRKCNESLAKNGLDPIDWGLVAGNAVT